jgi:uncharacterized membrane protein
MALGPLEYLIIGCPGNQFTSEIAPELHAIQEKEFIQVVDLLFLRKDAQGTVTVLEVKDLNEEEVAAFGLLKSNLMGLITHEDIITLSNTIPPDTSAVVVLLEHLWIGRLEQAIARANGQIFVGGMVPQHAHIQVEQELAAALAQTPQIQS